MRFKIVKEELTYQIVATDETKYGTFASYIEAELGIEEIKSGKAYKLVGGIPKTQDQIRREKHAKKNTRRR